MNQCQGCEEYCWYEYPCTTCHCTGYFIGAGVESIIEPHFYNMEKPGMLPCHVCGGTGYLIGDVCFYYGGDFNE